MQRRGMENEVAPVVADLLRDPADAVGVQVALREDERQFSRERPHLERVDIRIRAAAPDVGVAAFRLARRRVRVAVVERRENAKLSAQEVQVVVRRIAEDETLAQERPSRRALDGEFQDALAVAGDPHVALPFHPGELHADGNAPRLQALDPVHAVGIVVQAQRRQPSVGRAQLDGENAVAQAGVPSRRATRRQQGKGHDFLGQNFPHGFLILNTARAPART